ncbi:MAG TPA: siderophore-interacting protein [Pseudonocardia sp.]|nr:siderophore-interacting protein [Pseudonocardia sp.]
MSGTDHAPARTGHRTLQVLRTERVTPRMARVTLGGDELAGFPGDGPDQRIKLFFPMPGQDRPAMPRASSGGPVWPPGQPRPVIRTYTVRRFDAAAGELDVDFVLHGEHGPAAAWAAAAAPGDWVGVSDPGGRYQPDPAALAHLVIGDESALPAIATVLEALTLGGTDGGVAAGGAAAGRAEAGRAEAGRAEAGRAAAGMAAAGGVATGGGVPIEVFIEVADVAEEQPLPTGPTTRVHWLHRGDRPPGQPLTDAVTSAGSPAGVDPAHCQAWLSAEAAAVRDIRAHLLDERGLSRRMVYATGYWRAR